MSVKSIKKVREGKPFRPADLIVYGLLAALVVALFTAFVFTRVSAPLAEIYVDVAGERVLAWSAGEKSLTVAEAWRERVEVTETADGRTVRIYADAARTRYNDVRFTAAGAQVTDANCSAHKDCVHSAAITDASGVIICVPHKLKIYSSEERYPSLG